jgi:hypothetical protein
MHPQELGKKWCVRDALVKNTDTLLRFTYSGVSFSLSIT